MLWPLGDSRTVVICNVIGGVNWRQPGYYVDNSGPVENAGFRIAATFDHQDRVCELKA
jgi:hypothetical protein